MTAAELARVALVGAGPGDPGLITARALELIARADVILHDRLIPAQALEGARPEALVIDVGKQGGGATVPQERTEALLLEHAQTGRRVIRLKGGDPFVFGRGGEEALALARAGIAFEVVPGVTSGVAAPAYAGIPVTQRDVASAVALVTAHEDPTKPTPSLDWGALAAFPGTLVLYMALGQLGEVAAALVQGGRPPEQAAAIIERGTLPGQRVVEGTLASIAQRAADAGVVAPAVIVIGDVAALRGRMAWHEQRPLSGLSVAVTRARAQASTLALRLRELGAEPIEAPSIRIVALEPELPDLGGYDLVCLTSPNGVRLLFDALRTAGLDARALAGARVAAIGDGTALALANVGIVADVVPDRFVAEALVRSLEGHPVRHALVARAREARDVLPDALRARGAEVDVLALYATVAEPLDERRRAAALAADYITFTSSSTVTNFLAATIAPGGDPPKGRIVSIGPVTSATLRDHGLAPDVEAERHDIDGLVAALLEDAARRGALKALGAAPRSPGRL